MKDLIQIHLKEIDGSPQNVVDARELHTYLQSKQRFSDWIKAKIKKYGFVANQDYTSFHKIMKRDNGASKRIEYAITLDMAKELAMVESNAQGKAARDYFIACERKLKEVLAVSSEQQRILQKINQAAAIAGSLTKLGAKLGITTSIFSHINKGRWHMVSLEKLVQIETACDYLLNNGGALIDENKTLLKLMEVEPKSLRMELVKLFTHSKSK